MAFLESVLLTYENQFRVEYQNIAEFLRLLGIFVCEDMRPTAESEPDVVWNEQDYSCCYTVSNPVVANNFTGLSVELAKNGFDAPYFNGWYLAIYAIYQKFDLLEASVTLQYYRMQHAEVKRAGDCFVKAADAIVALIANNPQYLQCEHVRYAKLYCKQKANLAYFLCGEPVAYYVNDLAAEGLELTNDFSHFANAWVLLGLVYEISRDYVKDAIDAFQRAISGVGSKPYVSSIYYWLGRRCEEYDALRELQYDSYQRAYKIMPKYRNIYKVARIFLNQSDWKNALLFFKECLQCIERKGDYLDPLEQEYYFKVNIHISYIYLQLKNYSDVIVYAKRALGFWEKIQAKETGNIMFYNDMYKKRNPNVYINMTQDRLSLRQIWHYLAIAYQESGMEEVADIYWKRFRG